jgi:phage repressor protein C with HTH and peptisase S24 domain
MVDMETLAARVRSCRKDKRLTQAQLGKAVRVSKQTISAIERGSTLQPAYSTLAAIAKALDVSADWLLTGRGPKTPEGRVEEAISYAATHLQDYVRLRVMEGAASGGDGMVNSDYPEVVREIEVAAWQLRQQLGFVPSENRVQLVTVRGDSMYPDIKNGDVVMVDTATPHFGADGLYLINMHGSTFVKRLQMLPDGIHIISTNPKYLSHTISVDEADELHVGGRIVGVALLRRSEEV